MAKKQEIQDKRVYGGAYNAAYAAANPIFLNGGDFFEVEEAAKAAVKAFAAADEATHGYYVHRDGYCLGATAQAINNIYGID